MDGSPRRPTQANRQARRQSPYARPANPPQATPSRLRSVLSYLSPFRSSPKPEKPQEQQEEYSEVEEETSVKGEDTDSADEAAQFALHGRRVARESSAGIFDQHVPASPTPAHQLKRTLGPSSLSASYSMPNLAPIASTRAPGNFARSPTAEGSDYHTSEQGTLGGGGGATEELARFFREKAERGEEGLTAVEQAGVMHLMQQAQSIPTAFTPNFGGSTGSFSPAPPAREAATSQVSGASTYKRRRPLYVGAGYSSRRRKTNVSSGGISKSQSEGSLPGLASGGVSGPGSTADGKRRRTEDDEMEEDIPVASLDDVLVSVPIASSSASPSTSASTSSSSSETQQDKLKSKPSLSRFTGTTTPAKPSPLWQVSKAHTPSPSPPRKPSNKATTGAANLMLDVIQQVDAANPAPKTQVAPGKEAILNPYDNDENPLALASKRVPRSSGSGRSKSSTARQSARPKAIEPEKPKEKEISPLEQLERTMPAEYRRESTTKRSKPSSTTASPAANANGEKKEKEKKKPVEVVELLSSDVEEDDQLAEDADEEMTPAPSPPPAKKKEVVEKKTTPTFNFASNAAPSAAPSKASPTFGSSSAGTFPFSSTSSPAPKPTFSLNFGSNVMSTSSTSHGTPPRDTLSPSPSALTPPPVDRPSSPKASLPPTPPPVSTPFSFSIAPPSSTPTVPSSDLSTKTVSQKDSVAALPRSSLPLHEFDFASIFSSSLANTGSEDASVKAVKDLVRNMAKGELPTFAL